MERKGQAEMLEHSILVVIIIVLVITLLFFLVSWNYGSIEQDKLQRETQELVVLSKRVMSDPFFVRKNRVLDGAKLTALNASLSCKKIRDYLGAPFYLEIWLENKTQILFDGTYDTTQTTVLCNITTYPNCNKWVFCMDDNEEYLREVGSIHAKFPVVVNFFNDISSKDINHLATMNIGLLTR